MFSDVLLTVDYDRTLTGPGGIIPQRNLEAIRYFMENGGAFTVNTGRSIPMYSSIFGKVPVNAPLLMYNGGAAYDPERKEFLFTHEIPLDLWETVLEAHRLVPDMQVEIQARDYHYAFTKNDLWAKITGKMGCPYAYAKPGEDLGPFLKFALLGPFSPHGGVFDDAPGDATPIPEVIARIEELTKGLCSIYWSGSRVVDIQEKSASKASASLWLKAELNRKHLICIGDAKNDSSMMDAADFAFCPADGVIADSYPNVCPCGEGAVADVIYEKIPAILNGNA